MKNAVCSYYDSPIGKITLGAREDVLVGAWFEGQKYYMDKIIEDFEEKKDLPVLDQAEYWLDRYFAGQDRIRKNFLLHLQEVISERSMEDYRKNPIWMYHYLWKDRKDPCSKTGREKYLAAGSRRCGRT